ncbi:MAG TPA: hypothetical protein VFV48_03135, partial [Pseudomonadales bacterium]|nr:hypothetical protein [Pseudomonadales bacterium]
MSNLIQGMCMVVLFFLLALGVVYGYFLYPLLMWLVARGLWVNQSLEITDERPLPKMSLIITVH